MAKVDKPIVYDGLVLRPPDEVIDFEPGSSMTKQEFAEDCDLSKKMMRFSQTGIPPEMATRMGSYGDFSAAPDFMQAQEIIVKAREQFEALPSEIRLKFGNNPAAFLEFVGDEKNFEEASKLGILGEEAVKREAARKQKEANDAIEAQVRERMKEVKANEASSGK